MPREAAPGSGARAKLGAGAEPRGGERNRQQGRAEFLSLFTENLGSVARPLYIENLPVLKIPLKTGTIAEKLNAY